MAKEKDEENLVKCIYNDMVFYVPSVYFFYGLDAAHKRFKPRPFLYYFTFRRTNEIVFAGFNLPELFQYSRNNHLFLCNEPADLFHQSIVWLLPKDRPGFP